MSMTDEGCTPRVNGTLLRSYVGSDVRLVGKVLSVSGTKAVLLASDNTHVHVNTSGNSRYQTIVEVVGNVNPDLTLREISFVNFNDDFDLGVYNEMVQLTQEFKPLFG
eukprot:TRINITY_DN238_c0_g2_i1.p1 TRINITY_DN238_c0_g2~~TRINITY_DN238_c0_g2_i1.p1  ORF type:complete len:108 (-),score=10.97 TRINITY_DN238_c0_g2_i1:197-520(-)